VAEGEEVAVDESDYECGWVADCRCYCESIDALEICAGVNKILLTCSVGCLCRRCSEVSRVWQHAEEMQSGCRNGIRQDCGHTCRGDGNGGRKEVMKRWKDHDQTDIGYTWYIWHYLCSIVVAKCRVHSWTHYGKRVSNTQRVFREMRWTGSSRTQ